MIIVSLTLATICFAGSCHNALVGDRTPTGEFDLVHARIEAPGYGGDVLAFAKDSTKEDSYYSVHRTWLLIPSQHRARRIKSDDVARRVGITGGCINVEPAVYQKLVDCCSNQTLEVIE